MLYEKYLSTIDEQKDTFYEVAEALYDNPETSFKEFEAAKHNGFNG